MTPGPAGNPPDPDAKPEASQPGMAQPAARPMVRLGSWRIPLPRTRANRTALAVAIIVIGTLGFAMPVIGLWMWGPGMLILSHDSHRIRRFRRRIEVRAVRWWRRRRALRAKRRHHHRRHRP